MRLLGRLWGLLGVLGLVLALAVPACSDEPAVPSSRAPAPAAIGDPAPAFALSDPYGRTYSLADYAGQKVLLVFYMGYF